MTKERKNIYTHGYRLNPTKGQRKILEDILEMQRTLYNAALAEKREAVSRALAPTYRDQAKQVTILRQMDESMRQLTVNIPRWTLLAAAEAFSRNPKARYKSKSRWNGFGFAEFAGVRVSGKRLYFQGLGKGGIRIKFTRPLPENADIRQCSIRRNGNRWMVHFQVLYEKPEESTSLDTVKSVAIMPSSYNLATLSDGTTIARIPDIEKSEIKLKEYKKRLRRCHKNSKNSEKLRRKIARVHEKNRNRQLTAIHTISRKLVRENDIVIAGYRPIRGKKSLHSTDAPQYQSQWALLMKMLSYKAVNAGRKFMVTTTRRAALTCSSCQAKALPSSRIHTCESCGITIPAHENSARNMLMRGLLDIQRARQTDMNSVDPGRSGLSGIAPATDDTKNVSDKHCVESVVGKLHLPDLFSSTQFQIESN